MATYGNFIDQLRPRLGDHPRRHYETADGDAVTTFYQLQHPKILETSYTYKVGGITQVENTNFTQDINTGEVVFAAGFIPASGNDNVTFQYKSVRETDADLITIVNAILGRLSKKLWIEALNTANLTSVIDQYDYALSGIAGDIISVI